MTTPTTGIAKRSVVITQGPHTIICDGTVPFEILPSRDGTIGVAQNNLPVGVFPGSGQVSFTYHGAWPHQ